MPCKKGAIEQNFLTMLGHFPDLKNKYVMSDHSGLVCIGNVIFVGKDGTRYMPRSIRHVYSTVDFYGPVNKDPDNKYVNIVRGGSTCDYHSWKPRMRSVIANAKTSSRYYNISGNKMNNS